MDDDRTPAAQAAAGGATVPAGAGYAPSHQDDHDTDGGHDPAGRFVNAVNSFLASRQFKRDVEATNPAGLAGNMPPPPANITTDWYAKAERDRAATAGEKAAASKADAGAPPLHPVMIALIMEEARKKAEAAGRAAAGAVGADVVVEGRPDLDVRAPKKKGAITKEAWAPGMSGTLDMGSYFRSSGGSRTAADARVSELNKGKVGNVVPDTVKSVKDTVANKISDYGTSFAAKKLGVSEDMVRQAPEYFKAIQEGFGMDNGAPPLTPEELRDKIKKFREMGTMAEEGYDWYLKNKDTINTFKSAVGWFGKDGLGLGGKNWQYLLGGGAALGLGYAGYKMMSSSPPSNAHAAQQRGGAPRDPHSSAYEDMMIDMMMRRREQY